MPLSLTTGEGLKPEPHRLSIITTGATHTPKPIRFVSGSG